jgi:hypothetical protein
LTAPRAGRSLAADGLAETGKPDPAVRHAAGHDRRGRGRLADRPGGRTVLPAGAQRLRQDHAAADAGRLRRADRGEDLLRRGGGDARSAGAAGRGNGLPELRPLAAHDGGEERLLRPGGPPHRLGRAGQGRRRTAQDGPDRREGIVQADGAFRRTAAAGRPGPGAGGPPPVPAAGRAAVEPGRGLAVGHAVGDPADRQGRRHHRRLRHPRPGRGLGDRRSHRPDARGADRPDRHRPAPVRIPRQPVRGGVSGRGQLHCRHRRRRRGRADNPGDAHWSRPPPRAARGWRISSPPG